MMKWTALALLGVNLLVTLAIVFGDGPEPPQTVFPESDAPPVRLLSELEPPPDEGHGGPTEHAAPPTEDGHGATHLAAAEAPVPPATPEPAAHAPAGEHAATAPPHGPATHETPAATHEPPVHEASTDTHTAQAPAAHASATPAHGASVAEAAPEPVPAPEPEPPPKKSFCYRVGPLYGKQDLEALRTRLARHLGTRGRVETQKVPVRSGYWVFLPPQPMARAEATVRELRRKGIQDLYLIRDGDNRGAISLGLYKYERSAEKRRRSLAARGIEAQVAPRYKPGRRYWVNVHYEGEKAPGATTWRRIEKGFKGVSHRRQDCA